LKKQARRRKRTKEKKRQEKDQGKPSEMDDSGIYPLPENEATMESNIVDYFTPHLVVRASGKIRSFDFGSSNPTTKIAMPVCYMILQHGI
jgi:U3 small nucleolar RNA-associated protein 12